MASVISPAPLGIMHLTNTDPKGHDSAAASKEAAGAPGEIEITREMQKAGALALSTFEPRFEDSGDVVERIYRDMELVRRREGPGSAAHRG